jgi:hypothetical protein
VDIRGRSNTIQHDDPCRSNTQQHAMELYGRINTKLARTSRPLAGREPSLANLTGCPSTPARQGS